MLARRQTQFHHLLSTSGSEGFERSHAETRTIVRENENEQRFMKRSELYTLFDSDSFIIQTQNFRQENAAFEAESGFIQ